MGEKKYTECGLPVVSQEIIDEFEKFMNKAHDDSEFKKISDYNQEMLEENPALFQYIMKNSAREPDPRGFLFGGIVMYCLLKKEAKKGLV